MLAVLYSRKKSERFVWRSTSVWNVACFSRLSRYIFLLPSASPLVRKYRFPLNVSSFSLLTWHQCIHCETFPALFFLSLLRGVHCHWCRTMPVTPFKSVYHISIGWAGREDGKSAAVWFQLHWFWAQQIAYEKHSAWVVCREPGL